MLPRGMTTLRKAIASGQFDGTGHVEVWLDSTYRLPGDHPLGYLPCVEIVVGRRQRIDSLEFEGLSGQNVMIVTPRYSERVAMLADRLAQSKPASLIGVVLEAEDDPVLHWIMGGEHV